MWLLIACLVFVVICSAILFHFVSCSAIVPFLIFFCISCSIVASFVIFAISVVML